MVRGVINITDPDHDKVLTGDSCWTWTFFTLTVWCRFSCQLVTISAHQLEWYWSVVNICVSVPALIVTSSCKPSKIDENGYDLNISYKGCTWAEVEKLLVISWCGVMKKTSDEEVGRRRPSFHRESIINGSLTGESIFIFRGLADPIPFFARS